MPDRVTGLELAVLVIVVRLGADAYGAEIRRVLSRQERRDYSVGAVYTTLQRLEEKELLRSWSSEPRAERGGRTRRYFAVTRRGGAACRAAQARNERMWKGLPLQPRSI
jgi:DNA-binding PadR family transcriptional regulator